MNFLGSVSRSHVTGILATLEVVLGTFLAIVAMVLSVARPDIVELFAAVAVGGLSRVVLALVGIGTCCLLLGISRTPWGRRVRGFSASLLALALVTTLWHDYGAYSQSRETFTSDGVTLVGTLLRPRGSGPFPALVVVPGSGNMPRRPYDMAGDRLARMGFLVINPDKRGVGESGGHYLESSDDIAPRLAQYARDVAAAVAHLRRRGDVRHKAIGLWTVSQGGWVAPLAACATDDISYFVNVSGPATSFGEEDAFSTLADDEADHFGYRPPPISFEEIERRMEAVLPSGFDPAASLRDMRVPSLWLYGSWDNSLPVKRSVRNLEELRAAGLPITVRVFAEANHGLMIARGPHRGLLPRYAPGVWDSMSSWLTSTTRSLPL